MLSFLDALVIPNVIILGILNSLRPSKIHQYVSKCFGKFEGMKRFVSISTVLATSKKNSIDNSTIIKQYSKKREGFLRMIDDAVNQRKLDLILTKYKIASW